MAEDEQFSAYVRSAAEWAEGREGWGVITHEDPFGRRAVLRALIGPFWEKHGVDARGRCSACEARELEQEIGVVADHRLAEDEDADVLRRPLAEALVYGKDDD